MGACRCGAETHGDAPPPSPLKLSFSIPVLAQHKLEAALLALGQFQHALAELMAWLTHTEELLDAQKPINGDPKVIEVELAKHHVSTPTPGTSSVCSVTGFPFSWFELAQAHESGWELTRWFRGVPAFAHPVSYRIIDS